jgi:flagellar biosynthesis protein FlhF
VCAEAGRSSRGSDGRPLTIALVGPTGVGKTTTIAKLAATYRLKQGRRVGLITCDTYRIAAVDQLRTYAGIINIPLRVAMTPAEMRSACAAMADCDVILIDTAGRAPKDAARLGELRALIGAASPHQTHLVLSSSTAEASLLDAAERFAPLGCDRVILTKLDEAVSFGVVVNVLKRLNTRLSFVTTGQEVPDHIEAVTPDRLARLVMGAETLTR